MNQRERFPPDDPREWLNRARSNLAIAKSRVTGAYLEDLCFDAQQAAEKAIKAVLIFRGIDDFPYSHDLVRLTTILEDRGRDQLARCGTKDRHLKRKRSLVPESTVSPTCTVPAWPRRPASGNSLGERYPVHRRAGASVPEVFYVLYCISS